MKICFLPTISTFNLKDFQMKHNVAFKNGSAEDRLPMFIQTQRKEIDNKKKDFCADLNRRRGQIVKYA